MKYEVHCECGKPYVVTTADAGVSFPCKCGRTVEVPPLHQLRNAAGQQVLAPILRIKALLLEHRLPGTRACVFCNRDTESLIRVQIVCERPVQDAGGVTQGDVVVGGCLSVGLGVLLHFFRGTALPKERGQDVEATVPLPVCVECLAYLGHRATSREALSHIPEYAALLEQYPEARITRVS